MRCAWCGCTQSRVVDSRQNEDGTSIRRRRECEKCGRRFTTYERIELVPLMIIKKDQTREAFDVEKLRSGIVKSCEKRPVSLGEIDDLVQDIERKLSNQPDSEITSKMVGELVRIYILFGQMKLFKCFFKETNRQIACLPCWKK